MDHLALSTDGLSADRLLRNWRWLVPNGCDLLLATALGDLFLRCSDGVRWLDVGNGTLDAVAEDEAAFERALQDEESRDLWLGPHLVEACEAAGLERGPVECYSYLMLPVLGGAFEPSNFCVRTLEHHLDGWGPICERIAGLPDGARVTFKVVP